VSAEKTERLINLTLGLLSSKRFLTKNEIFKNIAGYSGSPETMERMFERDKDELRSMGIEIEVGQLDPLFEDEMGYLIKSSNIQIQPNEFTKDELLLMTMAANVWKESAFSDISKNALMKVSSIDSEIGFNAVALSMIDDEGLNADRFQKIIDAIQSKKYISFLYNNKKRVMAPFALKSSGGFWYLIGQEKGESIKVFKIIRIQSEIVIDKSSSQFEIPVDFKVDEFLKNTTSDQAQTAKLLIRENSVNALRSRGMVQENSNGWDTLEITFDDLEQMIKEVLWFGDDIVVLSPSNLRSEIISRLKEIING
jgi:proteasome accessory factor B